MIKLLGQGDYQLGETKNETKILNLNGKGQYVWINASKIGEILVKSAGRIKTEKTLAQGYFRLYQVKDEQNLTDLLHLEVCIGEGQWQGYVLPTGLPKNKSKNRIIATKEIISKTCNC